MQAAGRQGKAIDRGPADEGPEQPRTPAGEGLRLETGELQVLTRDLPLLRKPYRIEDLDTLIRNLLPKPAAGSGG